MPLYEYRCDACGHRFEVIQKFSDDLVSVCPKCGKGPVVKLLSSPAFQFKGTGWYITDYARKDSGKSSQDSGKASGSASSENSESKSSDKSDSSTGSTTPAKADAPAAKTESKTDSK